MTTGRINQVSTTQLSSPSAFLQHVNLCMQQQLTVCPPTSSTTKMNSNTSSFHSPSFFTLCLISANKYTTALMARLLFQWERIITLPSATLGNNKIFTFSETKKNIPPLFSLPRLPGCKRILFSHLLHPQGHLDL